ncbi:TPA: hypothetical protein ACUNCG_000428 [Aeromonas hydrophila]
MTTAIPDTTEITVATAEKNLKDAVIALRKILVEQKREPDSKATQQEQAEHWISLASPVIELVDAVKDAQEQLKVIDAKATLADFDIQTKLAVLGITKEALAELMGLNVQGEPEKSSKRNKKEKTLVPFRYMDKNGDIKDGLIADSGHVTTNTGHTQEVVDYWNVVSGVEFERPNGKDASKMVKYKKTREEIIAYTDDEIIRDFKHAITGRV